MGQQPMGRVDVQLRDSFNRLRESHNLLAQRFEELAKVGDIGALNVPAPFNNSIVGALNYLSEIQTSGGVAMVDSPIINCFVPQLTKLFFNSERTAGIGLNESNNIVIGTDIREIVVIRPDGSVGIGKTPSTEMDINGGLRAVQSVIENPSVQGSPSVRTAIKRENNRSLGVISTGHSTIDLVLGENGSDVRVASSGGLVGVGVDSASEVRDNIHVKTLQPIASVRMETPSVTYRAGVFNGLYQVGHTNNSETGTINNATFTITQGNRVGINRANPGYTLDVNGSSRVSSIISESKYMLGSRDLAVIEDNDVNVDADNINVRKELRVDGFLIADGSGFTFQATTDQVTEGSNLYFNKIRARESISSDSSFVRYSLSTGRITQGTLDDISEGSDSSKQFFSVSKARDVISSSSSYVSYNKTTGIISTSNTDSITEGTNNKFLNVAGLRNMLSDGTTVNFLNMAGSVRLSRHTTEQLQNMTGSAGDVRYNTTTNEPVYHDGIQWRSFLG